MIGQRGPVALLFGEDLRADLDLLGAPAAVRPRIGDVEQGTAVAGGGLEASQSVDQHGELEAIGPGGDADEEPHPLGIIGRRAILAAERGEPRIQGGIEPVIGGVGGDDGVAIERMSARRARQSRAAHAESGIGRILAQPARHEPGQRLRVVLEVARLDPPPCLIGA